MGEESDGVKSEGFVDEEDEEEDEEEEETDANVEEDAVAPTPLLSLLAVA